MRKKDEMEQRMANKSAKITLFVTVTALFIIGGIEAFRNDMKTNILLVIAQFSVSLVILLERYYLSKANGDDSFKKSLQIPPELCGGGGQHAAGAFSFCTSEFIR